MSDRIVTPDEVISDIDAVVADLENGPDVIKEAEALRDATALELKRVRAQMRLDAAGGTAERREARILIDTLDLEHAASVARIAYNYAKNRAEAAERALSGKQTIARLVETTYQGTVRR